MNRSIPAAIVVILAANAFGAENLRDRVVAQTAAMGATVPQEEAPAAPAGAGAFVAGGEDSCPSLDSSYSRGTMFDYVSSEDAAKAESALWAQRLTAAGLTVEDEESEDLCAGSGPDCASIQGRYLLRIRYVSPKGRVLSRFYSSSPNDLRDPFSDENRAALYAEMPKVLEGLRDAGARIIDACQAAFNQRPTRSIYYLTDNGGDRLERQYRARVFYDSKGVDVDLIRRSGIRVVSQLSPKHVVYIGPTVARYMISGKTQQELDQKVEEMNGHHRVFGIVRQWPDRQWTLADVYYEMLGRQ